METISHEEIKNALYMDVRNIVFDYLYKMMLYDKHIMIICELNDIFYCECININMYMNGYISKHPFFPFFKDFQYYNKNYNKNYNSFSDDSDDSEDSNDSEDLQNNNLTLSNQIKYNFYKQWSERIFGP